MALLGIKLLIQNPSLLPPPFATGPNQRSFVMVLAPCSRGAVSKCPLHEMEILFSPSVSASAVREPARCVLANIYLDETVLCCFSH